MDTITLSTSKMKEKVSSPKVQENMNKAGSVS